MLFPPPTPQSQVWHLSLGLQMQSQSETCSEPREAGAGHPETSTQIMRDGNQPFWSFTITEKAPQGGPSPYEILTLLLHISSIHLFQNPPACKLSITQSSCSFREKFFLCGLCWNPFIIGYKSNFSENLNGNELLCSLLTDLLCSAYVETKFFWSQHNPSLELIL